ncbi:serine O-acetyltransferase [Piscinibacter terrae]|uniref:Serine acetyltransferase n=1 Tax=Piscinibacter terrae TaxID=2496871 RepID=A0A3N7JN43_9BURK|nr:serine O-acetyltransferase [Albitalea terrae]RQP22649.1 serine O-acetyltransferase [Albitalea terrae]
MSSVVALPEDSLFPNLFMEIRLAASAVAQREPLLRRSFIKTFVERESFGEMLAVVLAQRMECAELGGAALYDLLTAILDDCEDIQAQAMADMLAVRDRDPAAGSPLHVLSNLKGFQALQVHRAAHHLWLEGRRELAQAIANRASVVFAVDIHPAAIIGPGVMIDHGTGVVIGETARIDEDVSIMQGVTLGGTGKDRGDRHPKIRRGVLLGAGAKVLGNIEIGTMSKVAAGSIVLKDVPAHVTVAGVPAKVVRCNRHSDAPALDMDQSL